MKRFPLIAFAVLAMACTDVSEDQQPSQNDSLAVIPVGPGTEPSAIRPPDTPGSVADTSRAPRDTMPPR